MITVSQKIATGLGILSGSFQVVRQNKIIVSLPIISNLVGILLFTVWFLLILIPYFSKSEQFAGSSIWNYLFNLPFYYYISFAIPAFLAYFFGTYISVILTSYVLSRFAGNPIKLFDSFKLANDKIGVILGFSVLQAGVRSILEYIDNHFGIFGNIFSWTLGLAWGIATFFVIPIISTDKSVKNPIEAVKKSGQIIAKSWGESAVVSLGISTITAFTLTLFVIFQTLITGLLVYYTNSVIIGSISSAIGILVIIGMIILSNTLSAIAKAALYYYATTNTSPKEFNKQYLQSALTKKQAAKIF